jgi:3-hydroxypropanoate dehydrogenase
MSGADHRRGHPRFDVTVEREVIVDKTLNDSALDTLFREARTHRAWQDREVGDDVLHAVYDLAKMAPTSGNCSPMRVLFVKSAEAKARLRPALDKGNVAKTMAAPATAIIAYDLEFYDHLPRLAPHMDARALFVGNDPLIQETAFRNGCLQGAYLIIAARALGLDCGPMDGFDAAMVDREFFANRKVKSNFLCNLGHGEISKVHPRAPRFSFDDVCKIL